MMMSMFSSLDALFAESFGQKVGFSWPKEVRNSSSLSENKDINNVNENKKMPENQEVMMQRRRKTTIASTRFAPELDGLHCFETIVPC